MFVKIYVWKKQPNYSYGKATLDIHIPVLKSCLYNVYNSIIHIWNLNVWIKTKIIHKVINTNLLTHALYTQSYPHNPQNLILLLLKIFII